MAFTSAGGPQVLAFITPWPGRLRSTTATDGTEQLPELGRTRLATHYVRPDRYEGEGAGRVGVMRGPLSAVCGARANCLTDVLFASKAMMTFQVTTCTSRP